MNSLLSFALLCIMTCSHSLGATTDAANSSMLCAAGQLTLTIHFDNEPTQINWQLKDASNHSYASAPLYGYPSSNAGQTITEVIPALSDGDYALVIYDAGGNGLCCTNGSGFYELKDGNNVILATGDIYTHSEITTFCYNLTNNDVFDLQPPTDPVLSVSNVTTTTVDLSWIASTDNVGVWAYGIIIDGVYADLTQNTNYFIWYLEPNTTYEIHVLSRDDFGNFSNLSNGVTFTTQSTSTSTIAQEVTASYFESGWDGWIDGGGDCARYSGGRSAEGNFSIRIRDNSGSRSSMTSPEMDLSDFDSVRVDFDYFHHGYENGEDFFVKISENGAFNTVKSFERGIEFTSNGLYSSSVLLKSTDYSFSLDNKLRFQSDASNNNDKIYVDAVVVTGYYQGTTARRSRPQTNVQHFLTEGPKSPPKVISQTRSTDRILIYPNPVDDVLYIDGINDKTTVLRIYSSIGELVSDINGRKNMIDVSQLKTGLYFIIFQDYDGHITSSEFLKK